jgi:hypothetical protein
MKVTRAVPSVWDVLGVRGATPFNGAGGTVTLIDFTLTNNALGCNNQSPTGCQVFNLANNRLLGETTISGNDLFEDDGMDDNNCPFSTSLNTIPLQADNVNLLLDECARVTGVTPAPTPAPTNADCSDEYPLTCPLRGIGGNGKKGMGNQYSNGKKDFSMDDGTPIDQGTPICVQIGRDGRAEFQTICADPADIPDIRTGTNSEQGDFVRCGCCEDFLEPNTPVYCPDIQTCRILINVGFL